MSLLESVLGIGVVPPSEEPVELPAGFAHESDIDVKEISVGAIGILGAPASGAGQGRYRSEFSKKFTIEPSRSISPSRYEKFHPATSELTMKLKSMHLSIMLCARACILAVVLD